MGEGTILLLFSISVFFPAIWNSGSYQQCLKYILENREKVVAANSSLPLQGKKKHQKTRHPAALLVAKADHMVTRVNRSFKKVSFNSEVMRGMKGQWTDKYQQVREHSKKK